MKRHTRSRRPQARVGYRNPPKRTQFKKGQSGNPKGRPKGSRNKVSHRTMLEELVRISKSKRAPEALKLRAAKTFIELTMKAAGLI